MAGKRTNARRGRSKAVPALDTAEDHESSEGKNNSTNDDQIEQTPEVTPFFSWLVYKFSHYITFFGLG